MKKKLQNNTRRILTLDCRTIREFNAVNSQVNQATMNFQYQLSSKGMLFFFQTFETRIRPYIR